MLKYASKLFMEVFLSVLATVIGSYLANRYIAGRPAAEAPVSLVGATVDPKRVDADAASHDAASHDAVNADFTSPQGPSDVANALGPVAAVGSRIVDRTNDEKAAPPVDKPAEPTSAPARLHRSAPRDKPISRNNTIVTPEIASRTIVSPELGRATTERFSSTNANSSLDAPQPAQEIDRDNGVSSPPGPSMRDLHLAARILKPIVRTASLLFEPSSALVGHADEPRGRASSDAIPFSSRARRLQSELTERSSPERTSSERTADSNDGLPSRRPETKTLRRWP